MLTKNLNQGDLADQNMPQPEELEGLAGHKFLPFVLGALFALAFMAIDISILTPFYETNDDVGLSMIVAGQGFAAKPDAHILFSHIFIGQALSALYSLNGHFPWYGSYLIICHFLSISTIATVLIDKHGTKVGLCISTMLCCAIEIYTLSNLQFTTTAFMLAAAGGVSAAWWIQTTNNYRNNYFYAAVLLLVASSLVRYQMFCLSLLLIAAFLCFNICLMKDKAKQLRKALVVLGLSGLFAFALVQVNNYHYYADQGWKDFYRNCANSGLIRDYNRPFNTENARLALAKVGWSQNDVDTLRQFLNSDEQIFSADNLQLVADNLPPYRSDLSAASVLQDLFSCLKNPVMWPCLLSIVAFLVWRRKETPLLYFIGLLGVSMVAALFLIVEMKLPARIYFCIAAYLTLVFSFQLEASYFSLQKPTAILQTVKSTAVLLLLVLLPSLAISANWKHTQIFETKNAQLRSTIAALKPQADQLYIVMGSAFPYEAIKPFDDFNDYFGNLKLLSLSCQNGTPLARQRMQEFGITDPFKALVERNNQIFLISGETASTAVLERYFSEHYGLNVNYERLPQLAESCIKLVRVKKAVIE